MKILILAHNLRRGGGIVLGTNAITSILKVAPYHDYFFIVPKTPEYQHLDYGNKKVLFYSPRNLFGRFLFDSTNLKEICKRYNPDFILGLGNFGLTKTGIKQAVLIQRAHLAYSDYRIKNVLKRIKTIIQIARLKKMLPYIQMLLFQTETMKRRFLKRYGYEGEIFLFPNIMPNHPFNLIDTPQFRILKQYKNHFKLLQLGAYYEHKNFELAIKLFTKYRRELNDVVLFITISPHAGVKARKVLQDIQRHHLDRCIINIGPVEYSHLASCYNASDALFFPTLLESFSATYVEAMRFGLPIITSDLDFAHEICGDAAIYFNPHSVESSKDAIIVLKDDLGLRRRLIEKGKLRLESFPSWDTSISNLIKAMERLAQSKIT